MSSGDVSEIANQLPMPSRPEEFHGESLTGRVAGRRRAEMGIAAHRRFQRRRSIGLGLLALGEGYPRRFFAARESEVSPSRHIAAPRNLGR
jgi:hypothetical protein